MKQHNMCLGCVSPSLEGCTGADFVGAEFMQSRVAFFEEKSSQGFPGGSVVGNLPASAGDTGSILGPGRCHMLWGS